MKNLLFSLFALITMLVSSQEVISTQGDSYLNLNGSVDFTIGEVVINTATDGFNDITQGFHQTNWNFVYLEDYDSSFEVTTYPNPMLDLLSITINDFHNVIYKIYDINGKLIIHNKFKENQIHIETASLAMGTYVLTLSRDIRILKTIQLIKSK
jgi:hypothetical protein